MTQEVSIIPLGGREEVGKNLIVIEYNQQLLVLDCGIKFPTADMPGVNLVMPKIDYLIKNQEKIKGLFVSHGHEDHIGAIPFLLSQINIPIYGTQFTLSLIKKKLANHNLLSKAQLTEIKPREEVTLNPFQIKFIRVNHSIPGAVAIGIETPAGTILYTGDFKFDLTPIKGQTTDFYSLAQLGEEGVLALLSDSTNAEREGMSTSEQEISSNIQQVFKNAPGRIMIATFSSHLDRIQQIINATAKTNRQLAISGRSMKENTSLATELGYLDYLDDLLISPEEAKQLANDQVVYLLTGSQGETMAALTRIARGEHRQIEIQQGDTILFSATPIPGNELAVSNSINQLLAQGAIIKYGAELNFHASGHAAQEELKLMLNLTKPRYFIPIHGEYRHLYHHALLANQVGLNKDEIFIARNGSRLKLNPKQGYFADSVTAGKLFVDGANIGDVDSTILQERQQLAQNGLLIIIATIDPKTNQLTSDPEIISQGFINLDNVPDLVTEIKQLSTKSLQQELSRQKLKDTIQELVYSKTNCTPQIIPIIKEGQQE
ncbi:ribonuclease J [Halanaerobaculum tunisiense]